MRWIGRTTGGSSIKVPLDAPSNVVAIGANGQVSLTWNDPPDKYATNEGDSAAGDAVLVSQWAYTRVIRKQGSAPVSVNDGTLVCESGVRNQYASTPFVDSLVENDTVYYYGLYAFTTTGVVSEGAIVSAKPIAGTLISDLTEGTLIKVLENGAPVEYYLAKHNYEPGLNGQGRELLVRKDVPGDQVWNSSEKNIYANGDMDVWFNNTFLNTLDEFTRSLIATTKFRYSPGPGQTAVGTLERAVFALSATELGITKGGYNTEGSALPIASVLKIARRNGTPTTHWTRTPYQYEDDSAVLIYPDGVNHEIDVRHDYGARPIFTLPSTQMVDIDLNILYPTDS